MKSGPRNETDGPVRHDMVRWYNPLLLVRTGFRAALAAVFGHFADRRELQAALNPMSAEDICAEYDYSGENARDFWFDFVADLGDGWNPTHAVACALGEAALDLNGERLPRGRLLIMGGDEIYPAPSREAYREKLVAPYQEALPAGAEGDEGEAPHLYALPGNHDWYDGLTAFSGLFCRCHRGPPARGRDARSVPGRPSRPAAISR